MYRVTVVYFDGKEYAYACKSKEDADQFIDELKSNVNVSSFKYMGPER